MKDGVQALAAISDYFRNCISRRCYLGSAFFICSKTPFVGADARIGPRGVGDAAPYICAEKAIIAENEHGGQGTARPTDCAPPCISIVYKSVKLRYNKTNKNFDESRSYHAHQSDRTLLQ